MTFDFYYKNDDELKELENILSKECENHFGIQGNPMNWYLSFDNENKKIFIYVNNKIYFDDLQRMKKSVYQQNSINRKWHDLRENPEDLPSCHWSNWVLLRYDNGNLWGRARYSDDFSDGSKKWIDSYWHVLQKPVSWKELNADEVLLNDWASDIEENLSFVADYKVKED